MKYQFPLTIDFPTLGQDFFIIGVRHVFTSSDPLIVEIKIRLDIFAQEHPNAVVITENNCRDADNENIEEAVKKIGEAGALHWFAHKKGLEVTCPELAYAKVLKKLFEKFDPEKVVYTMLWVALTPKMKSGTAEEVEHTLEKQLRYWNTDEIKDITPFHPTKQWFENLRTKEDSFSDEVMEEMNKIRDAAIFDKISELWNSGKSIFMVYGGTHVMNLLPNLVELTRTKPIIFQLQSKTAPRSSF